MWTTAAVGAKPPRLHLPHLDVWSLVKQGRHMEEAGPPDPPDTPPNAHDNDLEDRRWKRVTSHLQMTGIRCYGSTMARGGTRRC